MHNPHLTTLLLSLLAPSITTAALLPRAKAELQSCIASAVGGDATRAQFPEEANFVSKDLKYFNLNYQHKPFAVTYPQSAREVSEIVKCASQHDRKVQARSGGRDFLNRCLGGADDAIVIDLKNFNKLSVDDNTGIATIGPGNLLEDLVRGLNDKGRYMPHGSSATVGVGGHIMVGGIGYTSRDLGLSIDVLRELEVVLANGTVVRANKDQHQDLFWAMRGAGASFGIATEFRFQTKPNPSEIVTFSYNYTTEDLSILSNAVKKFQQMMADESMPRKLTASATVTRNSVYISGAFFGSKKDFDSIGLNDRFPEPKEKKLKEGVAWIDYMENLFQSAGAIPNQAYLYARDTAVADNTFPSEKALEKWMQHLMANKENWMFILDWYGGAVNDVAVAATPYPHRNLAYFVTSFLTTESKTSEDSMKFIDNAFLTLQDNMPERYLSYSGVPNARLDGTPQQKYWGSNLSSLEKVKKVIDPRDVFSTPQNIKPSKE